MRVLITGGVGEMIAAMTQVFGPELEARITWNSDPVTGKIVLGWRNQVISEKALRLGFVQDTFFEASVRWFLQDDIVQKAD
jgi:hypothetical protein